MRITEPWFQGAVLERPQLPARMWARRFSRRPLPGLTQALFLHQALSISGVSYIIMKPIKKVIVMLMESITSKCECVLYE